MTPISNARTAAIAGLSALLISATPTLADVGRYSIDRSASSERTHILEVAHMRQGSGHGQGQQQQSTMPGVQGQGAMGQGMMKGSGMTQQGMPMKGSGMMMGSGGMGRGTGGHGMVVTPSKHLMPDDARHYFNHWIEAHGNKRLKVGDVKESNDNTIVVDIVTVDDSLVRRFAVDRHSGRARPTE